MEKAGGQVNLLSLSLFPMIFTLKPSCSLGSLPFLFPSFFFCLPFFVVSSLCLSIRFFLAMFTLSVSPTLFVFPSSSPRRNYVSISLNIYNLPGKETAPAKRPRKTSHSQQ
jgi:hypothetical protein